MLAQNALHSFHILPWLIEMRHGIEIMLDYTFNMNCVWQ